LQSAAERFKDTIGRRGRPAAVIGSAAVGLVLIARGLITLL
jgi:hypothetical protein